MLSIITITRNDTDGLKETLESTKRIRAIWENIEQLVIDGSDGDLASTNSKFCDGQVKVKYINREPRGISDAFNIGISQAKYRWLWFLNGGDQLHQTLDLDFFFGFLRRVTADILVFQIELMQKHTVVDFPSISRSFPPVLPWIPHPATIISKDIFIKFGLFDEQFKIAMDYEFWIRVYSKKITFNMISIPLTYYNEDGISSTEISKVNREGHKVLQQNKFKLFKLWLGIGRNILKQYKYFNRSGNGN